MYCKTIDTPVGPLTIVGDGRAVTALRFGASGEGEPSNLPVLTDCAAQLADYFLGKRRTFDFPLAPAGTPFQQAVWAALRAIPWGETRTYGQIAAAVGNPRACRAVGMANNRNPIPIIIPCHRVVGSTGRLVGYAGGLAVKEALLRLERACP